jgi:hypothetical protein
MERSKLNLAFPLIAEEILEGPRPQYGWSKQ